MTEDVVKLTEAATEPEAAMICGYLESQGIRASYDKGGIVGFDPNWRGGGVGRQEIVVLASDLEAARTALAALREQA